MPLPLYNSLSHLTYLTSTSPRIREIMTMDGGLERLIRILHDFCLSPPPPENPNVYHFAKTGGARKAAQIPYPAPYATAEQAEKDPKAWAFNNAQRA